MHSESANSAKASNLKQK